MAPKRIVYILRSLSDPRRPYIGLTSDVRARLEDHNAGRSAHTARHRPWQVHVFLEDVTAWLELHDIRFTPNVKVTGRSGYDHTFDFVVPASRRAPERLIRGVNRPGRDLAEAMAFPGVDTKEVRPAASRFYAILNDENRPRRHPSWTP